MKIMNYKQMYEKGKAEEQKRILEIIDEWEWKDCFCSKMNGVCKVCDESERLKARIKDYPLQSDNRNVKGRKEK